MSVVGRLLKAQSTRLVGWLLALSPAIVLLIFILASWSWPPDLSAPVSDFLVEYPIPDENGKAFNIVAENPGQVWFTLPTANAIGSLIVTSTIDYRFDLYEVPTANSNPYDLVFDQARNVLWFTEHDANKLAYFDPASTVFTEYPISTTNSAPTGIDLSPDGKVWFVERDANQLASFEPGSELFQEFPYPVPNGTLEDIAVSNANSIWFTAPGVERVVRYVPDSDDFLSIPVNSGPGTDPFAAHRIVIGSNGHPWVTAPDMDKIGLLVPGTLTLWRWYNLPVASASLAGLDYSRVEDLHHLWYTESDTGHVGLLVISASGNLVATRRLPLSSPSSMPVGITVDSSEQVWVAEYDGKMIATWRPPYSYNTFLPILFN